MSVSETRSLVNVSFLGFDRNTYFNIYSVLTWLVYVFIGWLSNVNSKGESYALDGSIYLVAISYSILIKYVITSSNLNIAKRIQLQINIIRKSKYDGEAVNIIKLYDVFFGI